ncbi:MAG: hypothetical protein AB7G87_01140 [Clostridia bacterium]
MDNKDLLPEYCYGLQLTSKQIILIKKGSRGYCETCCPEGATQEMVDKLNEQLGVSKAQAEAMSVGSMFGWDVPGADPRCYENTKEDFRCK